jgi:hypothetical protein
LAAVALLAPSSASALHAARETTRAQYAAELHKIDSPLLTLYDTFYVFTDGRPVSWATSRTVEAQTQTVRELRRLRGMTPPPAVARQHRRILAALGRLVTDLRQPISFARQGRSAVLNWWLQNYGALPELNALYALRKSLSQMGYWAS